MYTPAPFAESNLEQLDWLAGHDSFGTLVSRVDGELFASHLPVLYDRTGLRISLRGHWARPNPQWKTIAGRRALFIFHGPHAYVSPRWYVKPEQHVPTWNYAVAHIYGAVRVVHDTEEIASIVDRLSKKYEAGATSPWKFEESNGASRLSEIVGFELVSDETQIKFKLNQNHPAGNVSGVVRELSTQPADDARLVAELMSAALAKRTG